VDGISANETPVIFDFYNTIKAKNYNPVVCVDLFPKTDGFRVRTSLIGDFGSQKFNVSFRPIELRPWPDKVEEICHSLYRLEPYTRPQVPVAVPL
jgi:hypothetical protein